MMNEQLNSKAGNYFQITPETAYSSPVYVHSHTRSLNKAIRDNEEFQMVADTLTALKIERDRIFSLVEETHKILEDKKQELIRAGFPVKNGKPAKLSEKFKEVYDAIEYARTQFKNWHKRTSVKYDHNKTITRWVRTTKLFKGMANNIFDNFFVNLQRKIEKKTGNVTLFSAKDVKKMKGMSLKHLADYLKKEYGYSVQADELANSILKLKVFWETVKNIELPIEELKKIYRYDISTTGYSWSVKHCLEVLKSGTSYFSKLGSLFELASEGFFDIEEDGQKITIQQSLASHLGKENENMSTSDIEALLTNCQTQIKYGVSLKSRSYSFKKTGNVLTANDMGQNLYALISSLINIKDDEKFRYYVLNVQALSLVRYSEKYSHYKSVQEGGQVTYSKPPIDRKAISLVNIIETIEIILTQIAFVKSVVGGLYDQDKATEIEKIKSLPVILSTPAQDYWTADILKYLIDITKNSENSTILKKYVVSYTPYNPYRNAEKRSKLENALVQLYEAKALNAAEKYKKEDVSYEDLEKHFQEQGSNRYVELKADPRIRSILKTIEKYNLMINEKRVQNLISKSWTIQFDYSNIK